MATHTHTPVLSDGVIQSAVAMGNVEECMKTALKAVQSSLYGGIKRMEPHPLTPPPIPPSAAVPTQQFSSHLHVFTHLANLAELQEGVDVVGMGMEHSL